MEEKKKGPAWEGSRGGRANPSPGERAAERMFLESYSRTRKGGGEKKRRSGKRGPGGAREKGQSPKEKKAPSDRGKPTKLSSRKKQPIRKKKTPFSGRVDDEKGRYSKKKGEGHRKSPTPIESGIAPGEDDIGGHKKPTR